MPEDPEVKPDDKSVIGIAGGLMANWKYLANLGLAGGIAVYIITVMVPSMQERFHEEIKWEREAMRKDVEKSREHGNVAARELSNAIREQTQVINHHQTLVRENQKQLIELQVKLLKKMD